ncbi:uncharacterized protein LOC117111941 [Anneissia japonica]|uniref:uncharacterized protein LOC117111941 n=1 Tax=Anneissia japonica TaxID=1529436 RepID=UPI00142596D4|nr:uncharacterized protein LOC117111941 [Anneissia japonica]
MKHTRIELLLLLQVVSCTSDVDIYTNFQAGFGGWTQGNSKIDWTRISGNAPSNNTGPTNGHSGFDDDFYLYIVASLPIANYDKALLISPTLPSKWTDFCVEFYYYMYGTSTNELILWYHDRPTGSSGITRWHIQGNKWYYKDHNFRNNNYHYDDINNYVYFEFVARTTFTGDVAIDDILISGGRCHENQDASSPIPDLVQSDVVCDDSYMTIYIGDSTLVDVTNFPPHLIDSDCKTFYRTYKNGMYWLVFVTRYDRCGTTVNFEDEFVEYSNAVSYKEVGNSTVISRETQHVLPVKCKLRNSGRSSINFDPQEVQLLGDDVEGSGNFSFTLDMYRESNFSIPYGNNDYPVVVDIGQTIYMGAHVTSYTGDIKLYIDYCVATPSSDENASPKYDLIENR